MNYNTVNKANVSRKKTTSSQDKNSSNKRDDENKKIFHTADELLDGKLSKDSLKSKEKLSTTMMNNTKKAKSLSKNLLKQNSTDNSSVSQSKSSTDRPIIDQSISSINIKLHNKASGKLKSTLQKSISHNETNSMGIKSNKKKMINDDDNKRRGISTIYMPEKRNNTAKEMNNPINKDINKSAIKNKDSNINKNSNSSSNSTNTIKKVPTRERKKSRTLSPSEIKILKTNIKSPSTSYDISSLNKTFSQKDSSSDYDYEDDFEDYESDFQECTDISDEEVSQISDKSEVTVNEPEAEPIQLQCQNIDKKIVANIQVKKYFDDEPMLDSGHYELQEARRRAARIDLINANENIRRTVPTVERSMLYSDEKPSETKSLTSSADEGFEDGRSGDFIKALPISGTFNQINTKYNDKIKLNNRRLTRGKQLLQMIKLDIVQWSLYESIPIAYDDFIRIHGKINTRQISMQTNDDNISVEIQTDEIKYKNMWTQFPVICQSILKTNDDINLFTAELAGVGSDDIDIKSRPQYDILKLNDFLSVAGNTILGLLDNEHIEKSNFTNDNDPLPFSDGIIKLSVENVTFLSDRPVTIIHYSEISNRILLTIHDRADEEVATSDNKDYYITDCCIGCQWNIYEPSSPIKCFYSSNNITACCFYPIINYNIIFGGLEDGSVSLWDLSEDESYHRRIIDNDNKFEWILRCVTFNSGGNFHELTQSKIVALTVLSRGEANIMNDIGKFMPLQICSLNEDGGCIVWSILKNFQSSSINNQDLGQSWWGKFRLVKSHEIPINFNKKIDIENLMCDFRHIAVDSIDTNHLYIASNINQVLHVTRFGIKPESSMFYGIDCIGGTTCIEICPFNKPLFIVGYEDGNIRLYLSTIKRPIVQLKNLNSNASIRIIQWSKSKPLTVYVLDGDAIIHIWNLNASSNTPAYSITPDKYSHVISMQLSYWRHYNDMKNQYMAIGYDNGTVEIHKLNNEFHYSHYDNLLSELKILLNNIQNIEINTLFCDN